MFLCLNLTKAWARLCEKKLKKPKVWTDLRFAGSYFADILVTGLMKTESHGQKVPWKAQWEL